MLSVYQKNVVEAVNDDDPNEDRERAEEELQVAG